MAELIKGATANELWRKAKKLVDTYGGLTDSPKGFTSEVLHILFELDNPIEKWIYRRIPPMSISFALTELMWIVNGSQDAKIIDFWNPGLKNFAADEGNDFYYGAYGYRLRVAHGIDQLERAYQALKNKPNNRQTVMLIWSPIRDIPYDDGKSQSNDIPCNICSLLKLRNGYLDWTQIMRSNDLILGLSYNLVQFTGLQEIMAGWLGAKVGLYNHYSDSLHIYDKYENIDQIGYQNIKTVKNTDILSIPKKDFDEISKEIFKRMKAIISLPFPTEDKLYQLVKLESKYEAYNNILYLIGAYAARRYKLNSLVKTLVKKCSNPMYKFIWQQWEKSHN